MTELITLSNLSPAPGSTKARKRVGRGNGSGIGDVAEKFPAGTEVTPEMLVACGLLSRIKHPLKVLGEGDITHALTIHAHGFSASAKAKIEAAGGTAAVIERAPADGSDA